MKICKKQLVTIVLILSTAAQLMACHKTAASSLMTIENPIKVTPMETAPVRTSPETQAAEESIRYDPALSMTENIDTLNGILEQTYNRRFSISTPKEYTAAGKPGWSIILDGDKAGFDTASWKYNYEPDSADGRYMEAVLTTCIFFYGDEMGDALWRLAGDLLDGGADENEYGFKHNGGQVVYKDTRAAMFGYPDGDEVFDSIYIWMTPNETGEYKDVID